MGFFKLGGMTMKSMVSKPETTCYPVETKPQPQGLKGRIAIEVNTCILCSACARSCPTNSIVVDKQAGTWQINPFSCITCFECVRTCPTDSLRMEPDYNKPTTTKTMDLHNVPKREKKKKAAS